MTNREKGGPECVASFFNLVFLLGFLVVEISTFSFLLLLLPSLSGQRRILFENVNWSTDWCDSKLGDSKILDDSEILGGSKILGDSKTLGDSKMLDESESGDGNQQLIE